MIKEFKVIVGKIGTYFPIKKDGKLEALRIQNEIRLLNWKNEYYVFENENNLYNVFVTLGDTIGWISIIDVKKESFDLCIKADKNAVVKYLK